MKIKRPPFRELDSSDYAKASGIVLPKSPVTATEVNAWLATLPRPQQVGADE